MGQDNKGPVIDLSKNEKQAKFFNDVMLAVNGATKNRFFAYGGAVRGGKTFVILFIIILLCKRFPGSRWHVVRATLPDLKKTTIPSFEKLAPPGITVTRDPGNWHAKFPNGSVIFFTAESITQDPELKSFLGLETNGIFIEQAEEASRALWDRAKERTGSWYINPMPPALLFLSFNPTQEWPRQVFYEPNRDGTLKEPYYYLAATPKDNPFVTPDQWAAWSEMDSRTYAAMIGGDWDALVNMDGRAYWAFDKQRDTRPLQFNPSVPVLHLAFDQNVKPYITMIVCQCMYKTDGTLQIHILKEYCLKPPRSTTKALCEQFIVDWSHSVSKVFLYGDASGSKTDTREAKSDYEIAKEALYEFIDSNSMRIRTANPDVRKSVLFLCALFEGKIPGVEIFIDPACENLIIDLIQVKQDANGGIKKETAKEGGVTFEKYGHTSDALRYLIITLLKNEFKIFEKLLSANNGTNNEQPDNE